MEDRYVLLAIQYDHSVASVRRLAFVYMKEPLWAEREIESNLLVRMSPLV